MIWFVSWNSEERKKKKKKLISDGKIKALTFLKFGFFNEFTFQQNILGLSNLCYEAGWRFGVFLTVKDNLNSSDHMKIHRQWQKATGTLGNFHNTLWVATDFPKSLTDIWTTFPPDYKVIIKNRRYLFQLQDNKTSHSELYPVGLLNYCYMKVLSSFAQFVVGFLLQELWLPIIL